MRPKHLAIELSKLQPHPCTSVELEQYATEGDLAAYWILGIDQVDEMEGKRVLDLGAGNGILGLGCLLVGAQHVTLVEADPLVVEIAKSNAERLSPRCEGTVQVIQEHISLQSEQPEIVPDIVLMNPPWGVQTAKADRPLLEYAFSLGAPVVHVLHSAKSKHVQALGRDYGYESEAMLETEFRLPPTYLHHSKKKATTTVRCWRFHRPGDAKLLEDED
ncbi:MAG: METTL5 family protein [Candidatus Poseidoniaceae archaeon]|jgi:putative methylase|tara:strand:- start:31 stop:684 length:654 start_codon:yes stop_codon:yes gene_type:complete